MELTLLYAITGGAFSLLLVISHAIVILMRWLRPWIFLLRMHLLRTLRVPPRHLLWSWTNTQVILLLIYLAANIFCCYFRISTAHDAAVRAARLSLVNLTPTYFGLYFSFLCDLSGISLHTYRIMHGSAVTVSLLLALTHVVIDVVQRSKLKESGSLRTYGTIVSAFSPHGAPLTFRHIDNYGNGRYCFALLFPFYHSRLRGFPSLSLGSSYRNPLQFMEKCPLKKHRDLYPSG
jgi:hypothetical protein